MGYFIMTVWLLILTLLIIVGFVKSSDMGRRLLIQSSDINALRRRIKELEDLLAQGPVPAGPDKITEPLPIGEPPIQDIVAAVIPPEEDLPPGEATLPPIPPEAPAATGYQRAEEAGSRYDARYGTSSSVSTSVPASREEKRDHTVPKIMEFIRQGNAWVAGGVLFIVLGMAFAFRYISMYYHIPGELKVAGGLLLGGLLFAFGWKQRINRRTFGMIIQGGGIGILYLSLFAAAKIYYVLPIPAIFIAMALLILLSGVISVLQNSQIMALFAAVIGFAVPVLLSDGSGNYIALFSYYLMLNLCVLGIALKKYWRYLNASAFMLTVAVGLVWGLDSYTSAYFTNIEVFLVLFFLIFTAINVLSSMNQPTRLIENSYAVTTSFVYIALQLYLTKPLEYGQAVAAFTLGAFYIALSLSLGRANREKLKNLITLYLSLGIIFINMTLPLALPGNWTYGIWAIEGAVLAVLGLYQKNLFFRLFGLVLAVVSAVGAWTISRYSGYMLFINHVFIVRLLSVAALFAIAYTFNNKNKMWEKYLSWTFYVFGLLQWITVLMIEIYYHFENYRLYTWDWHNGWDYEALFLRPSVLFAAVSVSGLIFALVGYRLKWRKMQVLGFMPLLMALLQILYPFIPVSFIRRGMGWILTGTRWADYCWIGWLAFLVVQVVLIYVLTLRKKELPDKLATAVHAATVFIVLVQVYTKAGVPFFRMAEAGANMLLAGSMLALLVSLGLYLGLTFAPAQKIPVIREYPDAYRLWGTGAFSAYLVTMVYRWGRVPIREDELLRLPIINRPDLVCLIILAAVTIWYIHTRYRSGLKIPSPAGTAMTVALGATFFYWLHTMLGRTVAYYSDIPYLLWPLFYSGAFQLAIAILWGAVGFFLMMLGHLKARRIYWIMGAALLLADALKLFLIDLSRVGTLPRIGSFMIVGIIFIVIGYFVPLPPKENKSETH